MSPFKVTRSGYRDFDLSPDTRRVMQDLVSRDPQYLVPLLGQELVAALIMSAAFVRLMMRNHRPQRSASVPRNRNRRWRVESGIHDETFDFDNDDSASSATRPVHTHSRGLADREQTQSPLDRVEIFFSCRPSDS